jgi:plastocyanin
MPTTAHTPRRALLTLVVTGALAGTVALAAAGCGSSSTSTASTSATSTGAGGAPTSLKVVISNYAFHPAKFTVAQGAHVTFVNDDTTNHTATATTMAFDTGTLGHGQSKTVTLSKPGTYTFYCQFHAFMRAVVTVG